MSPIAAPDWLHPLLGDTPGASLLVGGVGHLLLNREEEAVVTAALEARVLPLLRDMAGGRPITLFTGLAPGADLLLMDRASNWCERNGQRLRKVAICPVPSRQLIDDWILRARKDGYTLSAGDQHWLYTGMDVALASCDAVVRLYRPEEEAGLADAQQRQDKYRQLAAVLAEHSDMLVAVLQDDLGGQPGGTAEVVDWRKNPAHIPRQYSSRPASQFPATEAGLILVNPMPARVTMSAGGGDARVNKTLLQVRTALKAGNELLANDVLYRALRQGIHHPDLHYLRVQVLAGIGSSVLALREYEELAPPLDERDERWLTLLGRINKDLAMRSGKRRLLLEAAEPYLAAWRRFGSSYSAINAASLFALANDLPQARTYAQRALAAAATEPVETGEQRFYTAATRAEANLLLGRGDQVAGLLVEASQQATDHSRSSRTRRQLHRLCTALGVDVAVLAALTPPPLLLMRRFGKPELGPREALDTRWLATLPALGGIFMGVCDCVDLLLVEAFQARGERLHLVLPYRADRLIKGIHKRYGEGWADRLEHCLQRAVHVHTERGFLEAELHWAASNVTERALGLSLLTAQRTGGQLRIVEMDPEHMGVAVAAATSFDEGPERTALACAHIYRREPPPQSPEGRRMVGLIFADFAGFQRLEDRDLPYFWQGLMRGIGQLLLRHGEAVLLRQTWGDALHIVTADARTAAAIMADIQQYLDLHRLKPDAPLANLTLRIAGHYAPAYESHDPIHNARTYFGTQLSLTARIEPVTPPGQIYATEAFAARLVLEDPEHFALEYTGEIELAKRFGDYRLYSLRRLRG